MLSLQKFKKILVMIIPLLIVAMLIKEKESAFGNFYLSDVYSIIYFYPNHKYIFTTIFGVLLFFINAFCIGNFILKFLFRTTKFKYAQFLIGFISITALFVLFSFPFGIKTAARTIFISTFMGSLYVILKMKLESKIHIKKYLSSNKQIIFFSCVTLLVLIPVSAQPEMQWDATWYHLNSVTKWILEDKFTDLYSITFMWGYGVQNFHVIILTLVSSLFGIQAATLFVSFTFVLVILCVVKILQLLGFEKTLSYFPFITIGIPIATWVGTTTYSDTFSMFMAVIALEIYVLIWTANNLDNQKLFLLLLFLTGFSYGIKFSCFLFCLLLSITLILRKIKERELPLRSLILSGFSFLAGIFPFLFNAYKTTGNPLYPYLMSFFPTNNYTDISATLQTYTFDYILNGRIKFQELLYLPYLVLTDPTRFEGLTGPIMLGLIVVATWGCFLLFFVKLSLIKCLIIVNFFWIAVSAVLLSINFRYLTVLIPSLLIVAVYLIQRLCLFFQIDILRKIFIGLMTSIVFLWSPLFSSFVSGSNNALLIGPLSYNLHWSKTNYDLVAQNLEAFPAIKIMNRNVPALDKVLDFTNSQRMGMYSSAYIVDAFLWTSPFANGIVNMGDKSFLNFLSSNKIGWIVVSRLDENRYLSNDVVRSALSLVDADSNVRLYRVNH